MLNPISPALQHQETVVSLLERGTSEAVFDHARIQFGSDLVRVKTVGILKRRIAGRYPGTQSDGCVGKDFFNGCADDRFAVLV